MIARTARRVTAKLRGSSLPRCSLSFLRRELERLQEKFKKRSERIAELEKQVQEKEKELSDAQKKIVEQEKRITEQQKQITEQEKQITEQEKQITDLERQLALHNRNSTNSSKPPSSDGLAGEQRPRGRKHKSKRKPGGQPGHPGHHRPLIPTVKVNVLKVLLPERCEHCGRKLPQKPDQVTTKGESRRHQVTEIPEIQPHTTEYQCPQVVCEHCEKTTQAPLPEEVRGNFGPHLTALIAYWTVVCRVPRRVVEAMLADVWGLEISLGSTQKAWEEVSQAVEQPCQQLQEQLPREAAQDLFRQSKSQWRNRHGPLTHRHPNLQGAAASRVGLSHGNGTTPSPPDCCAIPAPTADLTPELLRFIRLAAGFHPV